MTPHQIRRLRESTRLTQAEFARTLHPPVHKMTVWRWENGRTQPGLWHLHQLTQLAKVR